MTGAMTYTVTRNDGDSIRRGLTQIEAAAAICEIKGWPDNGEKDSGAVFTANLRSMLPCGVYSDDEYDAMVSEIAAAGRVEMD